MPKNELSEGVVGRKLIAYFITYENKVPLEAESLGSVGTDQHNYRITFVDGSVSDWHVTFEVGFSLNVESAEMYNEVI